MFRPNHLDWHKTFDFLFSRPKRSFLTTVSLAISDRSTVMILVSGLETGRKA
jgi:hypothetical protein